MTSPRNSDEDGVTRPLLARDDASTHDDAGQNRQDPQEAGSGQRVQGTFKRNLGTLDAFAIIVSIVIGSGVFTSPGSIDTNVPSPGAALIVWLVGGLLAWTGASTMAELGTAIPGEGDWFPKHLP